MQVSSKTPVISVIVPIYNSELHLAECIESILNQSFSLFELILVDDGSIDNSAFICDSYKKKDNRIHVIHKKNEGVSVARNNGIQCATGEYIVFVDSDDTVDYNFLSDGYSKIKEHNAEMYVSGLAMEYWSNNKIINKIEYRINKSRKFNVREMLELWDMDYPQILLNSPCCKLLSKQIIDKYSIRFDDSLSRGEDTCFNFEYLKHINQVFFDSEIYYHYRRESKESLFSRFCRDIYNIQEIVYGKINNTMIELGCKNKDHFDAVRVGVILGCIHQYFKFKKETSFEDCMSIIRTVSKDSIILNSNPKKMSTVERKILISLLQRKKYLLIYFIFRMNYLFLSIAYPIRNFLRLIFN